MKIKTITCHNVDNHGANLQAYALLCYLERMGHEVEIINYCPKYFNYFQPFTCSNPRYDVNIFTKAAYLCAKFPGRLASYVMYIISARKSNFEVFRNKHYKLTRRYFSFAELRSDPPQADLYIAGSDQIWNPMMNNGKDPAFFLQFVPEGKIRVAYAASFAVTSIPEMLKPTMAKQLKMLDYIGVRESSALSILEDMGITAAKVVLDPVFLLHREEWMEIEADMPLKEKYLLVYDFEKSEEIKNDAVKYAYGHGLKIYSLYNCDYCDRSFENYGPDIFLALVHHATFILSNSFHATAFSLIYEKNFFVIERIEGINSRMTDLLKLAGVEDRISNMLDMSVVDSKINYSEVREKLYPMICASEQYLKEVTAYDQ